MHTSYQHHINVKNRRDKECTGDVI